MISISDCLAMTFSLSGGQAHDAPEGRALLESWDKPVENVPMVMDRAYEGDKTRQLVRDLRMTPVVPPKANRKDPRDLDEETCKRRNEVERLFGRPERWRRVCTRYDKLDVMHSAFVSLALVYDMI